MSSEQWNQDGDCTVCRRKTYCKKQCRVRSEKIRAKIIGIVFDKMTKGIFGDSNYKSNRQPKRG